MSYDIIHGYADLFSLKEKKERILSIPGFGYGTYEKIIGDIEKCRDTSLGRLLYGMSIEKLGANQAKAIDDYFKGSWNEFEAAIEDEFKFYEIDGISESLNKNIYTWYKEVGKTEEFANILGFITFPDSRRKSKSQVKTAIKEAANTECAAQADEASMDNCFAGMNVAFTGIVNGLLPQTMSDILKLIGANPSTEVNNDTDVLVVGKTPNTAMLSKAFLKGAKILTGDEFAKMLAL